MDTAPKMIERAFGIDSAGTKRIAVAADIAQNPPMPMPNNTRPINKRGKFGEKYTIRHETI
ncbi:hypothetical protein GCM10027454_10420 [Algoriphagus aestuariicola]